MGKAPDPPGDGAAQLDAAEIDHREFFADLSQAAGVFVVEWRRGLVAAQPRRDHFRDVLPLLFGRRCDAGNRLAIGACNGHGVAPAAKLGLVNSIPAVALIYTAMFSPFAIFLLRTYVLSIPYALEEAAQVDGAKAWQTFFYVVLPMMRPGLLTVAIIVGLNAWNEFVIAVTFLQNDSNVTAIVKFYNLSGQYSTDWGEMLAAAVIIVLPVVAVFVLLQRRFIEGMTAGAVKS